MCLGTRRGVDVASLAVKISRPLSEPGRYITKRCLVTAATAGRPVPGASRTLIDADHPAVGGARAGREPRFRLRDVGPDHLPDIETGRASV